MAHQQALTSISQHISNLETILTGAAALALAIQPHAAPPHTTSATPSRKKPRAPSILQTMKSNLAARKALEASQRASLSALIETSIEQTESLLEWPKPPKNGQPSVFDTAFRALFELKEEQRRRIEEYERRARVLKMKLEIAKIAVKALGREVRGLREVVEGDVDVVMEG
ncbi:uncharacterized protein CLAFUR5_02483 [Fulvia fulva]|uniref:Uncharacterized protein n=1 Tax=Passalora fulva TaxID=5499 RepID=A0A9Q8P6A2_PASFU|nr:uncharacterized protein CLAFUR5_02483 [Fulvia fulva]UJO14612.1 hypothetical protein CLAFUR5_02483 [Fulvia fulva]